MRAPHQNGSATACHQRPVRTKRCAWSRRSLSVMGWSRIGWGARRKGYSNEGPRLQERTPGRPSSGLSARSGGSAKISCTRGCCRSAHSDEWWNICTMPHGPWCGLSPSAVVSYQSHRFRMARESALEEASARRRHSRTHRPPIAPPIKHPHSRAQARPRQGLTCARTLVRAS